MDLFINEKSIPSNLGEFYAIIDTFKDDFSVFCKTIELLDKIKDVNIFYRVSAIEQGLSYLEGENEEIRSKFNIIANDYLIECQGKPSSEFYYYCITHQDFGLAISENIANSSLSIAADKILLNHDTAVLNLPNSSYYRKRPYVPILKSPYNAILQDELANVPCFDDAQRVKLFVLLREKIKPIIQEHEQDFILFDIEYQQVITNFDFTDWKPKQFEEENKLYAKFAFPASNNEEVKKLLSEWKITNGSYEDNKASYKTLGGIVAELHGYSKNDALSNHYKYEIYEGGYGNEKLFISLDTENGAFEMIDISGTHIGVYSYNGSYIKHYTEQKEINNHSLRNISESMFLFK